MTKFIVPTVQISDSFKEYELERNSSFKSILFIFYHNNRPHEMNKTIHTIVTRQN